MSHNKDPEKKKDPEVVCRVEECRLTLLAKNYSRHLERYHPEQDSSDRRPYGVEKPKLKKLMNFFSVVPGPKSGSNILSSTSNNNIKNVKSVESTSSDLEKETAGSRDNEDHNENVLGEFIHFGAGDIEDVVEDADNVDVEKEESSARNIRKRKDAPDLIDEDVASVEKLVDSIIDKLNLVPPMTAGELDCFKRLRIKLKSILGNIEFLILWNASRELLLM